MKVKEYIQREWARIQEQPPKQRWEYFWEYYKWPLIGVVLAIVLLIYGTVSLFTAKETALSGVALNSRFGAGAAAFWVDYFDYVGMDSAEFEASVYTDISLVSGQNQNNAASIQRIMAGITIQDTDFITGSPTAFRLCAYSTGGMLADLRDFLSEDALAKLAGRIFYIDRAVLEEINKPVGEQVEPELLQYPDPLKPETMKDPVPVGIDISSCKAFAEGYYLPGTTVYWGIVPNTPRAELTLQMLDCLLK